MVVRVFWVVIPNQIVINIVVYEIFWNFVLEDGGLGDPLLDGCLGLSEKLKVLSRLVPSVHLVLLAIDAVLNHKNRVLFHAV